MYSSSRTVAAAAAAVAEATEGTITIASQFSPHSAPRCKLKEKMKTFMWNTVCVCLRFGLQSSDWDRKIAWQLHRTSEIIEFYTQIIFQ